MRTFCQNPGGFVSQENYDNDLAVVNGHSYKELKSSNTNLAILCSHNFSTPFNQPISYAQKVGELTNMLANGHILCQRFGDILDGKRLYEDVTYPDSFGHSFLVLPDGSYVRVCNGQSQLFGEAYSLEDGQMRCICKNKEDLIL